MASTHVVIIGAGPAGLCLALGLAARGLAVDILDSQSEPALADPAYDGREVALTHRSVRLLRELGVWQQLPAGSAAPLQAARIMDGMDAGFTVDARALGRDHLGMFVSNHLIRKAAWQAVRQQPAIRVWPAARVDLTDASGQGARVTLADGRRLEAGLVVAADSRFSATRRHRGVPVFMQDMGLTMVLSRVRHELPNHAVAWEWFGQRQTRALLPVGPHEASAVVTVPGAEAQRLVHLSDEDFSAEITARYEGRLGRMEPCSTRHSYPLVATWAARFTGPRFALVGDTAVGMHPVTAHGFNLGLASVEHLVRATGDGFERTGDPGDPDALRLYERRHRASSAVIFAGTQAVARLFTNDHAFARPLRRLALAAGQRLPALPRGLAAMLIDESARPSTAAHLAGWVSRALWPQARPAGR